MGLIDRLLGQRKRSAKDEESFRKRVEELV